MSSFVYKSIFKFGNSSEIFSEPSAQQMPMTKSSKERFFPFFKFLPRAEAHGPVDQVEDQEHDWEHDQEDIIYS